MGPRSSFHIPQPGAGPQPQQGTKTPLYRCERAQGYQLLLPSKLSPKQKACPTHSISPNSQRKRLVSIWERALQGQS